MARIARAAAAVVSISVALYPVSTVADSGSIEYFDGGTLRSQARLSLGFLYGSGSRPDGLGSPVSTLRSGMGSAAGNPSGLAFSGVGGFMIDVLPPLDVPVSDIADLGTRAQTMVDDSLEGSAAEGLSPRYPELEALAGQQAGIVSGTLVMPVGSFVGAISLDEPMTLQLDLVSNGIEAFAGGIKGQGEDNVDIEMRAFADAACDLSFRIDRTTAAVAARVAPDLGLGGSISRYHARARVEGVLRADGIVNYGGQEYSFNDETDPWSNDLGGSISGEYEGDALGWSLGASYRRIEWLAFDAQYVRAPQLRLTGELVTRESMPPAATDDGLDLSEVSASQPTLTETTVEVEDDPLGFLLPSYAGVAATARLGPTLTTLEYRAYSGAVGYEHRDQSECVELLYGLGLEFSAGGAWIGGGIIEGRLTGASAESEGPESVLIPLANLGFGFKLGDSAGIDLLLLAMPMQVARVSLSYEF